MRKIVKARMRLRAAYARVAYYEFSVMYHAERESAAYAEVVRLHEILNKPVTISEPRPVVFNGMGVYQGQVTTAIY